jgi:hypothetical protein
MGAREIIFVVDESSEGGFEARALSQSIYTQADTFDALKEMARDAVHCHFEESMRPQIIRLHLVRDVVIPVRGSREISRTRSSPPLFVGSILADVASYLEISKSELVNTLFG